VSGTTTCLEEQIQQLRGYFESRYPGLLQIELVDMTASNDEETQHAYYLIKSRALVPPLVTVNRRLCLYGELDADSLQQAVHRELERRCAAPPSL
jgi:uncharacterized OsmC-like protein